MRNLLYANFFRLKRDRVFWLCIIALLVCSAGVMVNWCLEDLSRGFEICLEKYYFRMVLSLGMFQAVFACLFLSTEYHDGTIRNKLAVGHTRRSVYLSHFLTILLASLCMILAWFLGGCAGIPLAGIWRFGFARLAFYVLMVMALTTAFAAIFTFLGMLCSGQSVTVVMVLTYSALLLAAGTVDNILWEPEFVGGIFMTIDGTPMVNPEPNPRYVSGAIRAFYEFLQDLLPSGQAAQVQNLTLDHPVRALVCDVVLTAAFTLGGLKLFERKDLK